MGVWPPAFGSAAWFLIHTNATRFDALHEAMAQEEAAPPFKQALQAEAHALLRWFDTVPDGLPCPMCAQHARDRMRDVPMPRAPEDGGMAAYWVAFHNAVNKRTGKRELTEAEAKQALDRQFSREAMDNLTKAEALRQEDHGKIQRLQRELTRLGHKDPDEPDGGAGVGYKALWFLIGLTTGVVFVVVLWLLSRIIPT